METRTLNPSGLFLLSVNEDWDEELLDDDSEDDAEDVFEDEWDDDDSADDDWEESNDAWTM